MDVHHVDDQPARLAQGRRCGLRQEQRRAQVGADEVVELCSRDAADRSRVERGRVVHEHVEPAEASQRRIHQRGQPLDVVQVGAHGERGARARPFEFGDQRVGSGPRLVEVHHDAGPRRVQAAADCRAEALGAAGDEYAVAGEGQGGVHGLAAADARVIDGVTIPEPVRRVSAGGFAR